MNNKENGNQAKKRKKKREGSKREKDHSHTKVNNTHAFSINQNSQFPLTNP